MLKYRVSFNKSRGLHGRGPQDHVWRVLHGKREWVAKHVIIEVPHRSEPGGSDWNTVCDGEPIFFDYT